MKKHQLSNFIFSSSCTVYGQADELPITENAPVKPAESPYGNTKQIGEEIIRENLESLTNVEQKNSGKVLKRLLFIFSGVILIILFLPWTQNIQTKGKVTTLNPGQRPQSIEATIAGRIDKWYVREGQFVKKGDTIMQISEVKSEYFDPNFQLFQSHFHENSISITVFPCLEHQRVDSFKYPNGNDNIFLIQSEYWLLTCLLL